MLVVFGGLPGTGKTTLAEALAARLRGTYLRIDAIESALGRAGLSLDGAAGIAGYLAAETVAEASLRAGSAVVVDAVNPIDLTRRRWTELAARTAAPLRTVEVVCSDRAEHRRRVEAREPDLEGQRVPTWAEVEAREYEAWPSVGLVVDTAELPLSDAVRAIEQYVADLAR